MWIHPSQHGGIWFSIVEDGAKPDEAKDRVAKLAKGDSWGDWRNIRTKHIKGFVLLVELEQSSDVSKLTIRSDEEWLLAVSPKFRLYCISHHPNAGRRWLLSFGSCG
jgi:hypothetical protein